MVKETWQTFWLQRNMAQRSTVLVSAWLWQWLAAKFVCLNNFNRYAQSFSCCLKIIQKLCSQTRKGVSDDISIPNSQSSAKELKSLLTMWLPDTSNRTKWDWCCKSSHKPCIPNWKGNRFPEDPQDVHHLSPKWPFMSIHHFQRYNKNPLIIRGKSIFWWWLKPIKISKDSKVFFAEDPSESQKTSGFQSQVWDRTLTPQFLDRHPDGAQTVAPENRGGTRGSSPCHHWEDQMGGFLK